MVFKCFNCHATDNLYAAPHTQEMRERWLELFPEGDISMFNDSFRICAEHFDNKYILPTGLLSTRAVPTKFLVHNVWCEIEDENDEQQNSQSEQQMDTASDDDRNSSISATDSELLVKSFVDQRETSATDYRLSNLQNASSTMLKNNNFSSSSIFHNNSNVSAIQNQTKTKTNRTSNINQVSFFAHDETFPTLNSAKKFKLDTGGCLPEDSKTNHFKHNTQSRPLARKRESRERFSFAKDSTFHSSSPEPEDKQSESSHKSVRSSPSTSKRLKEKSIEQKSSRLSYSPPPRNNSATPKPILSQPRKTDKKQVKFHPKVKYSSINKTLRDETSREMEWRKSDRNSIEPDADASDWQRRSTHKKVVEIKNEETYSVKRRKKMPIILLKRLKFPHNLVPRLGTLLDIREMRILNNFKLNTENSNYPTKQEHNVYSHTVNGAFSLNGSMNISTTFVDLTLDDSDTNDSPQENSTISRLASSPEIHRNENNGTAHVGSNCLSQESPKQLDKSMPANETAFEVREDPALAQQLNLYNAELLRVKKVQSALYKQYRTYNEKFTKLQNFLDQLAKNGLIMKRDEQ